MTIRIETAIENISDITVVVSPDASLEKLALTIIAILELESVS